MLEPCEFPDADRPLLERIRARLMTEVRTSPAGTHATVRAAEGAWQPLAPGLEMKLLNVTDGVRTALVRMAAGARFPAHAHALDEECLVLEGSIRIGELELNAGDYHVGHLGSRHAEVTSTTGAVAYMRGI